MTPERRALAAAQRQLDAYNARDIDAFAVCFREDVEVYDLPTGTLKMKGRAALAASYGAMFEATPSLHAALVSRSTVGRFAFDREVVTGRGDAPVHAMAVYEVDDDEQIARVWFVMG